MARFGIIQFPGTNCERETQRVVRDVLGQQADVLWHGGRQSLADYDCLVLPGGFSHGDHLRAGAIARFSPIMADVTAYAQAGGLTLGICNGFQILLEAGLLPGAMVRNAGLQFRSEWVWCRVERIDTPFSVAVQGDRPRQLRLPIAHGEGNYVVASDADLAELKASRGVLLRYVDAHGDATVAANPNGSVDNIAGIVNAAGNVCGMMPHPERASEAILGSDDGLSIFASVVAWLDGQSTEGQRLLGSGHVGV